MNNEEPQINYYGAGDGWVGYTIWWRGRIVGGGELRSRAAAVKDAKATVRRLKAEDEQRRRGHVSESRA